jgi:hypothetical protein
MSKKFPSAVIINTDVSSNDNTCKIARLTCPPKMCAGKMDLLLTLIDLAGFSTEFKIMNYDRLYHFYIETI